MYWLSLLISRWHTWYVGANYLFDGDCLVGEIMDLTYIRLSTMH